MDISVRPVGRDEGAVLDTVFAGLSPRSRYLRFHSPIGDMGPPIRRALLAVDGRDHAAVTALADRAEPVGVRRVHALVLPENTAAMALLRSVFPVCLARRDRDAIELVCLPPGEHGWDIAMDDVLDDLAA